MGTTTIHVPDNLLADIDHAASSSGMSRNRFVIEACREAVHRFGGEWPDGFFTIPGSSSDHELLAEATRDMEREIESARRNRGAPTL